MNWDTIRKWVLILAYLWGAYDISVRPNSAVLERIEQWTKISPEGFIVFFVVGAAMFFWSWYKKKPAIIIWYIPYVMFALALITRGIFLPDHYPVSASIVGAGLVFMLADYYVEWSKWSNLHQSRG